MIAGNVWRRVFRVKCGNNEGTCFTIHIDNKAYFITAKHVLEKNSQVFIHRAGQWENINVTAINHCGGEVDISVISTDKNDFSNLPMPPIFANLAYGQDVYFLGFPYGMMSGIVYRGHPIPFVKKAIVSNIDKDLKIYLDGHNNQGFSGGPVVFKPQGSNEFQVAGVISSYNAVHEPITIHGKQTQDIFYSYNTGIINAYNIEYAVALIKSL